MPGRGKRHEIHLELSPTGSTLALVGDIDATAAADLKATLRGLLLLTPHVLVDMSAVTSCDRAGLEPLLASMRERQHRMLGPLVISRTAPPVDRLLGEMAADVPVAASATRRGPGPIPAPRDRQRR